MLPDTLVAPMAAHLAVRRTVHQRDVAAGRASVYLPDALARKYPSAAAAWHWQYVFAAATLSTDPRSADPTLACLPAGQPCAPRSRRFGDYPAPRPESVESGRL